MASFLRDDDIAGILAALLDASDDAIITVGADGVVQSWNDGARRLYGFTPDEIVGQPLSLVVPTEHRDTLAGLIGRTGEGRVEPVETVHQAKDGQRLDVRLTVAPVRDAAGAIVGAMSIVHDLSTERRTEAALRTSELRWRSVIDSAVDGIIVIDSHGRIEAFNHGAERLFGYRAIEVVGHNVSLLMPSPDHEQHDGYLARHLATGSAKIIGIGREVTGRRRDGTTFPLHLSVGEMIVGGEPKFTGILHDLTARVRIEEQLREHAALARLGEMAAVIAHEVKNPLAGVRGAIEVIGRRMVKDGKDGGIVREIINRIDALNGLMEDLLLFARPPQPKTAPVDLPVLIESIAGLLEGDPTFKDVKVTIEGAAPAVSADSNLLKIVFENLLVNGAQALRGPGTIRVAFVSSNDVCEVAVTDSGPGIPPEVRDKIFTPFFTTKRKGSGLGLPTAKRLIEAQRGHISIACPAGGGTTVTVRLPLESARSGATAFV